jgi:arylsulfatase A-like enzyme
VPRLPELLADSDYRTGYVGKWHLGDETFAQHGFDEWQATEDGYTAWYGRDRDQKLRSQHYSWLKEKGYKPHA